MGNAFMRERTFLKSLDLCYGVTTYTDKWLKDLDAGCPLPIICYTSILPSTDSVAMFSGLTTNQRIALNAETIELFEDRDNAMMILSQEISYRKDFFSYFTRDCDEEQPIGDRCIVDKNGVILASICPIPPAGIVDPPCSEMTSLADEDKDGNDLPADDLKDEEDGEEHHGYLAATEDDPATFEKLDLVLYLVSPYLNCEDKILLDVALEGSSVRSSPFLATSSLCENLYSDAVADISVDIYTDIQNNGAKGIVGNPYIGWIFSNSYTTKYYSLSALSPTYSRKCICSTGLRHLYRKKSYRRLRGIARSLDDIPRKRDQTVLGYNFVHTLTK